MIWQLYYATDEHGRFATDEHGMARKCMERDRCFSVLFSGG
jgi:hypothetical protein